MRRLRARGDAGELTLIELMVILIVVGIIAAVVLPLVKHARGGGGKEDLPDDGLNYEVTTTVGTPDLNATIENRMGSDGNYQAGVESNYLSALSGQIDAPDDASILVGVGGSICYSAEEKGVSATWIEFEGSSYGAHDQVLIFNAAMANLC